MLRQSHSSGVFIIDDFLSNEECNQFIEKIKQDEQNKNIPFAHVCDIYNHKQIDTTLSDFLWNKIKDILPNKYIDQHSKEWTKTKASHIVASAHYKRRQHFSIHTDTGLFETNVYLKKVKQ